MSISTRVSRSGSKGCRTGAEVKVFFKALKTGSQVACHVNRIFLHNRLKKG